MAGPRSLVASLCLYAWMKFKRIDLFPSKIVLLHTAPFFVALEAHFLPGMVLVNYRPPEEAAAPADS